MSVLGYDCEGKPLYVGDRASVIYAVNDVARIGSIVTVQGVSKFYPGQLRCAEKTSDGFYIAGFAKHFKKLASDDKSTWDETEKATGWKPVRECA